MPGYYSFFQQDHDALVARCKQLAQKNRSETHDAAEAVRLDSASQDGATMRLARETEQLAASHLGDLQQMLAEARIVEPEPYTGRVQMGSLVELKEAGAEKGTWFCVTSKWTPEAGSGTKNDPTNISYGSPIARAIMGKAEGATAKVQAKVTTVYEILAVEDTPYPRTSRTPSAPPFSAASITGFGAALPA